MIYSTGNGFSKLHDVTGLVLCSSGSCVLPSDLIPYSGLSE